MISLMLVNKRSGSRYIVCFSKRFTFNNRLVYELFFTVVILDAFSFCQNQYSKLSVIEKLNLLCYNE